jgi:multiple sugar transport system permease protein
MALFGQAKRWSRSRRREALVGLAFITPCLLGFLIFNIGPIVASLLLSFTDYDILGRTAEWIGLDNYRKAFSDRLFLISLKNTLYYTLFRIPLSLALAFGLAIMVRRATMASTVYRTAFYVPSMVPSVGAAIIWLVIFNPQLGLLNQMLRAIGLEGPGWLTSPTWAKPAIILMNLWQIGGSFVIFLAGLQEIPVEYYEAARVDGASFWHGFWRITVPLMTPTILFVGVIESIYAFQVFEAAFITTGGGPLRATYFMALYVYDTGFRFLRMGLASAIAWFMFLLILSFTVLLLRSSNRWVFWRRPMSHALSPLKSRSRLSPGARADLVGLMALSQAGLVCLNDTVVGRYQPAGLLPWPT